MLALPDIEAENDRLRQSIRTARTHNEPLAPADALTGAFATRRITRDRACDGKRAYRTPDYAARQAERYRKQFGPAMHAYFCHYCLQFHLATDKA